MSRCNHRFNVHEKLFFIPELFDDLLDRSHFKPHKVVCFGCFEHCFPCWSHETTKEQIEILTQIFQRNGYARYCILKLSGHLESESEWCKMLSVRSKNNIDKSSIWECKGTVSFPFFETKEQAKAILATLY